MEGTNGEIDGKGAAAIEECGLEKRDSVQTRQSSYNAAAKLRRIEIDRFTLWYNSACNGEWHKDDSAMASSLNKRSAS